MRLNRFLIQIVSVKNYVSNPTPSDVLAREILSPTHWVVSGSLFFVLWDRLSAQTAIVFLSNAIAVRLAVPSDNEATWIRLRPASLFLSLSRLGGCRITVQATKLFVFGGERFDFIPEHFVGGGGQGNGGGEFQEHRIFVGGSVGQVIEIALEFLVLDGFSS